VVTVNERFWSKVQKGNGCWELTASKNWAGYGKFWDGKHLTSGHRHSWIIAYGTIPDGMWVLHRCDNPGCVRPDHLFLGVAFDNIHDMMQKGRRGYTGLRGEKNPRGKLCANAVVEIRNRFAAGETRAQLAVAYQVGWSSVDRIVSGQYWPHLTEADRSGTTVLTPGEY
jgi:hypothetical protein